MVALPSEFRPAVEAYRGPLDLLLYLIKKEEVDVFDIPIARIIEQYQVYLELMSQVDPNLCGEFLVMAANLMEIKSKLLLPREELSEDEDLEDPRLELVRQLLEYKKYKERAMLLQQRIDEWRRRHERPPVAFDPEDFVGSGPVYLGDVSVWDLFTAFHRIQIALSQREPHRVMMRDRPIEEYIAELKERLASSPNRTAHFEDLFADVRSRQEAIGFFLAILEMVKEHLLAVSQEALFGPISIRLRDEEEVRRIYERLQTASADLTDPAEKFLLEGEGRQALNEPLGGEMESAEDVGPSRLSEPADRSAPPEEAGEGRLGAPEGLS